MDCSESSRSTEFIDFCEMLIGFWESKLSQRLASLALGQGYAF